MANVTVQQRSLELAQELARQNKVRVDAGQIPPLDLVQAEAEVAQRRENLIRANTAAEDAEDRAAAADHGSGRRVVLARRGSIRSTSRPAAARCRTSTRRSRRRSSERYDLARAGHELENAQDERRVPRATRSCPTCGSRRRIAAAASAARSSCAPAGSRASSPARATGASATRSARCSRSDYPTWSFGVTVSYPLGRSYEEASLRARRGRAAAGGAADREPAAAGGRDRPPGGAAGAQHGRARGRRARRRDAGASSASTPSSGATRSDSRRPSSSRRRSATCCRRRSTCCRRRSTTSRRS